MRTKKDYFVKENQTCPYCRYKCECASSPDNDDWRPSPGDLSLCLMCTEASQFTNDLSLIKFDLNSITDIVERNRLKVMQAKMSQFFEEHPEFQSRRYKVLTGK